MKIFPKFFLNDKKTTRRIVVACCINLFFLLTCFFLGKKFYLGISDDYFMARILEGVYGDSYNVRMTFVNVLYGYALLPLYYLFPKIGWYYIGEIIAVFASFTTISYVIIKKMGLQWGSIFSILLVACFARDFYLTVQFTQCAAALGAAGMLLWICSLENGFSQKSVFLWAFFLMIWGYCMRRDAFLMGVPFFACAMLFFLKKAIACKYRFLLCIAIIICGMLGAKYYNKIHYTTPEYQRYLEFQPYRVMLGDKDNYDKGAVFEEINEEGLYSEDYSLLLNWVFYDPETFAVDSLKRITDKVFKYSFPLEIVSLPFKVLYRFDKSIIHPCCWAFCLISLVLLLKGGKRSFYVFGAFIVMMAMLGYLIYLSRLLYRVEIGLWLYATVLAIPLLKNVRPLPHRVFFKVLASLMIAYMGYFYFTRDFQRSPSSGRLLEVHRQDSNRNVYKEIFEYMDSFPDNTMFLVPMSVYQSFSQYRCPFYLSEPFGSWKRIVSFGFWTPYFPDVENSLRLYGVENPMRDVVKENVIVISNNEMMLDYLHRHYYENAEIDTLRNIGGVKFFKYSEGENGE